MIKNLINNMGVKMVVSLSGLVVFATPTFFKTRHYAS